MPVYLNRMNDLMGIVTFAYMHNINVLRAKFLQAQILRKGDIVMISNDQQTVVRLQQGHGGWNDQMKSVNESIQQSSSI